MWMLQYVGFLTHLNGFQIPEFEVDTHSTFCQITKTVGLGRFDIANGAV